MLEPAEDVLGRYTRPEHVAQGLIEPVFRPGLGQTEPLLDFREHLFDRRVIRAVRWQWQHTNRRRSRSPPPPRATRWGLRLSKTTTSPSCSSGTSTRSTYVRNAAVSVAPGNASGAQADRPSPKAAITVTVSHEAGAEPRLPARPAAPERRWGSSPS